MSEFFCTLASSNKQGSNSNMATKVQIKSEKVTAAGGIFYVQSEFKASRVAEVIDCGLGSRTQDGKGYKWKELRLPLHHRARQVDKEVTNMAPQLLHRQAIRQTAVPVTHPSSWEKRPEARGGKVALCARGSHQGRPQSISAHAHDKNLFETAKRKSCGIKVLCTFTPAFRT